MFRWRAGICLSVMFLICLLAGLRLASLIIVSRAVNIPQGQGSRDVASTQNNRPSNKWEDLADTYEELCIRFPPGFPYNRNGVRLGIAALEDETAEVYEEWRDNKKHLGNCKDNIRTELLQVAAVAMMIIDGIDSTE